MFKWLANALERYANWSDELWDDIEQSSNGIPEDNQYCRTHCAERCYDQGQEWRNCDND